MQEMSIGELQNLISADDMKVNESSNAKKGAKKTTKKTTKKTEK
jgi:hypothetical protein